MPSLASLVAFVAGALAILVAPAALACRCVEDTDAIEAADLIFEGIPVESAYARPCRSDEPWWASPCSLYPRDTTFEVREIFKGEASSRVTVRHGGDSCGVTFRDGPQVVLAMVDDDRASTSYCLQRASSEQPRIIDMLRWRRAEQDRDRRPPYTPAPPCASDCITDGPRLTPSGSSVGR